MQTLHPIPQVNRRFDLQAQLGQGGMGVVYKALDRLTGEAIALKHVLAPANQLIETETSDSNESRLALAHEFQTLASLRHPNIIGVLDYGFDTELQPYFTMEMLDSPQTIAEAGYGQSLEFQIDLLVQLLRALTYLHQRQLLHRDLKPNNVLVEQGVVKVVDFGLSIDIDRAAGEAGTLPYMAPEVILSKTPSVASDLYAVGVIAYEMLSGKRPFAAAQPITLTVKILREPPDIAALNVSPALGQVIERLLAKSAEQRYGSATDVIQALRAATGQSFDIETQDTRESFIQASKFIGRDSELERLSAALSQAIHGSGSAYLIGGESGVGKSRLFQELKTLAQVQGAIILSGQAVTENAVPYQLWRDSLRRLALLVDLDDAEAGVLKSLVPDIASLLGRKVADAPQKDRRSAEERLQTTVGDLIRRHRQPLVIILEDLQWAHEQDLALLAYLNSIAPQLPLLIMSNYRDEERPKLPDQLPGMQTIKLSRLSKDEISALSASMLGRIVHQTPVVDLLVNETEGNVFFLVEVVRALAEEAGQLDKVGNQTLPAHVFTGGIRRIVRRRLDQVPPADRPLLQIAAVAGRQLDIAVLRASTPNKDVQTWLAGCLDVAVLEVVDGVWRFAHDKLREEILRDLDDDQRRELNSTVALAIEHSYSNLTDQAARLTYHWGLADNPESEAHYALIAAQTAVDLFATNEPTAYFTKALDALAKLPDTLERRRLRVDVMVKRIDSSLTLFEPVLLLEQLAAAEAIARTLPDPDGGYGTDERRLAHVLLRIGNAYYQQNKLPEALNNYRFALVVGRKYHDDFLLLRPMALLGRVLATQGHFLEAEPLLREATEWAARVDWRQWALNSTRLGFTLAGRGQYAEGLAIYPPITEQARAKHAQITLVYSLTTPCTIYLSARQDMDQAAQLIYDVLGWVDQIDDLTAAYLPYGYAMWIESRRGNYDLAFEFMRKAREILHQAGGTLMSRDTVSFAEAELAFNAGHLDDAFALANDSLSLALESDTVLNQARVHCLMAQIHYQRDPDAWDDVQGHVAEALALCEVNDMRLEEANIRILFAEICIQHGDLDLARTHLQTAAEQFATSGLTVRLSDVQKLLDSLSS